MAGGETGIGGPPQNRGGPQQQGTPDITIAATVAGEGVNPGLLQAVARPPGVTFTSVAPPLAFTSLSVSR